MKDRLLTENKFADTAIVFYIAKKLVTPYKRWSAFELDIIDEKGKILKKRLSTREEKNAFTILDKFILKLRNIVGDNTLLKIGITGLILMDYKEDGKVIEEYNSNVENKLFSKISETILNNFIAIDIPLANRDESIKLEYEKTDNTFNFNLGVYLKDELVSSIGGNYLPIHQTNTAFFDRMNNIINTDLDIGGHEILFIDEGDSDIGMAVTYNSNEIKIVQQTENDRIHSDFYMLFSSDKEKLEFVQGWNRFYQKIIF